MTDIDQDKWDNSNLFSSTTECADEHVIAFQGVIPQWLRGTLYRNGPGANEVNEDPCTTVKHAFDGFGLIQKYAIDGSSQKLHFRASFIKSRAYKEAIKHGHLITRQFGTDPCKTIFGRIQGLFSSDDMETFTDDTSVTIQKVNDELLALTETAIGNVIDAETLETIAPLTTLPYTTPVDDEVITVPTAHVMRDRKRKMTVGYAVRLTKRNDWIDVIFISDENLKQVSMTAAEVQLNEEKLISVNDRFLFLTSSMSERGKKFNMRIKENTRLFRFSVEKGSYMHSAVLTENYLILSEIPLHFTVFNAILTQLGGKLITDMFDWNGSKRPTMFRVINLDTGEQVAHIQGPAFFDFHHINAYEQTVDDRIHIVIDICAYDDQRILDEFYLKYLRKNTFPSGAGFLRRFHLDLKACTCTEPYANAREPYGAYPVSYANSLVPVQFELPRINPRHDGKPYRFLYAVRAPPNRFFDGLVKIDVELKVESAVWAEPFSSPSEPIFVPRPDASVGDNNEDDGVVLSVVLEQKAKRSFLLILDGKTFKELGRAYLPIHIPLSFHGNFY